MVMSTLMPHDAAAAEQMVLQATKNQQPDRLQYDDILTKQLFLNREMSRVMVEPPTEMAPIFDKRIREDKSKSYRRTLNEHQRRRQTMTPPPRRPKPLTEKYIQPSLFEMESKEAIPEEYIETPEDLEMGYHVDVLY